MVLISKSCLFYINEVVQKPLSTFPYTTFDVIVCFFLIVLQTATIVVVYMCVCTACIVSEPLIVPQQQRQVGLVIVPVLWSCR